MQTVDVIEPAFIAFWPTILKHPLLALLCGLCQACERLLTRR